MNNLKKVVYVRILLCILILSIGVAGMYKFASLKVPPKEIVQGEQVLRVEVIKTTPEDINVSIKGYGEVRPVDIVRMAAEVSGRVLEIHPDLEVGELIKKGELLFKIDPRDYQAAVDQTKAAVSILENTIIRLKKEYQLNQERLKTLKRNQELAQGEFKRVQQLFRKNRVGTRSGVDMAESSYNNAATQAATMAQNVTIYPLRIKEAELQLTSAQARLSTARTRLIRCMVTSPFNGRLKAVAIEAEQFVQPGQVLITLANDAVLEIIVPLNSPDARAWLRFNAPREAQELAWFSSLVPVKCRIYWTEDPDGQGWEGYLHRVVKVDARTRTLSVAVQISAQAALGGNELPLVEGMFCQVKIPGRVLRHVFRLPRWAVSYEKTVYLAVGKRLQTKAVHTARLEGDYAFVDQGLKTGDLVITTRLIDPLENILLQFESSLKKDL